MTPPSGVMNSENRSGPSDEPCGTPVSVPSIVSIGSIGNRARSLNHIEAETPQPFNRDAIQVLMLGFTKGKDVQVVRIEQVANIIGILIHRANIQSIEPKLTVNSD